MKLQLNSAEEIQNKTSMGIIKWRWPIFILFSRTFLFFVFGFIILLLLSLFKVGQAYSEVTRWWTYQVIGTNVLCFFILRWLASKENMKFPDLFGLDRGLIKKDMLLVLALLIPSGAVGYFSVYIAGILLYGNTPPAFMFQSLPLWAAIFSVIFFPLTNALIETTTYFGYAFQRIAVLSRNKWLEMIFAASFLALQHIGIPLYLDPKYFLWRFLSFLPFALFAGYIYLRIRRLLPIMVLHYLADLPLAIVTLVMSLRT